VASSCVGLDIGSSSIKAITLATSRKGTRLLQFGIEPLPSQAIVDGTIMDQSAVVEAILRLRAALGIKTKQVATAISGHSVIVKKIQLPPLGREELANQIVVEAEQHIPFRREEVDLDFHVVSPKNAAGQMEIILVAAKKETIADYVQVIRDAKLVPVVVDVAVFSAQNAYEASYGDAAKLGTTALVHVGAGISHVNIVVGGSSVFARDVTVGGAAFTEEIQKRLHVSHEDAEQLKLGAAAGGTATRPEVVKILDEVAEQVAMKLQRSLDFFLASTPDISLSKIYLSGGSARLDALVRVLGERAHVPVEILDPFKRTEIDDTQLDADFVDAHAAEGTVAFGLALRKPGESAA